MGTSTRKRNSKVKEILNSYGIGSDISKLPEAIPQIFATAISKKVIENEFSESVFLGCIRGGMSGIGAIRKGNFTLLGLGNDFIIDKNDPRTINEIKQSILSNIDFEENETMQIALNKALTKIILEEINTPVEFLKEFFSGIFEALLHSVTLEELIEEVNENICQSEFEKSVKAYSIQLIDDYYRGAIENYINSEMTLEELFSDFYRIKEKIKERIVESKGDFVEGVF